MVLAVVREEMPAGGAARAPTKAVERRKEAKGDMHHLPLV